MNKIKIVFILAVLFLLTPTSTYASIKNWGLGGYGTNGETPTGADSKEFLKKYDSYYVGDKPKEIYLTFDAGYEAGYTENMLDVMKKHNVNSAFFLTGNYVRDNPEIIKRMVEEGHIVANHTMTHPDMTKLNMDSFKKELDAVNEEYKKIIGTDIPNYYRPPAGKYTEANLDIANQLGYKTIFWSLAYVDFNDDSQPTKEQAFKKLIPRIHDGAVILLHNTSKTNSIILDELIQKYKDLGYTFGSLDSLTGMSIPDIIEETEEIIEEQIDQEEESQPEIQKETQPKRKLFTRSKNKVNKNVEKNNEKNKKENSALVYADLPLSGKVILIDAGHGGFDPGKVERGTEEKEINLKIALKLQSILEMSDAYVIMTRAEDEATGDTKDADMGFRKNLANISEADILISIHQNAYTDGKPLGPVVFHYNEEDESKALAQNIQKYLNDDLARSPNRLPKQNKNYFIIRTVTMPAVIVECGFLTNSWDFDSLRQDSYQDKVAWAIYKGLVDYFEELENITIEKEISEDAS